MRPINEAIAKGVAYLETNQLPDGSFPAQISTSMAPFRARHTCVITFASALILDALNAVHVANAVKQKLATWLLAQKGSSESFNYWPAGAAERKSRPYPDDFDDTCCALAALYRHNKELVTSTDLAGVVRLLVAAERKAGGPYRTWIVPGSTSSAWHDVDLAVNCNIAYFIRLIAQPLPKLTAMMDRAILTADFTSPYYPLPHIVMYFLARGYTGAQSEKLALHLLEQRQNEYWDTPVGAALALSALNNLNVRGPESAVQFLLASQRPDGSWPAETLWLDRAKNRQNYYAGSVALSTAFALEALSNFVKPKRPAGHKRTAVLNDERIYRQVIRSAKEDLRVLGRPLRERSRAMLYSIERADKNQEIVLLPYMFARSLAPSRGVSEAVLRKLSLANLFGWMAYTIYDDFIDDEGKPPLLPVANIAMRLSLANFDKALPGHAAFQRFVRDAFNRIDAANEWEMEHCRFVVSDNSVDVMPRPTRQGLTQLAERSIGHTLTPVGVLAGIGLPLDDPSVALIQKSLRHYLTARQLNDDLHDWREDVRRGHISYVVACILSALQIQPGTHYLRTLLPLMERQFWRQSVVDVCQKARRQLVLGRRAYQESGLLKPVSPLLSLFDSLDASMAHTLQKQREAQEFLKAYKGRTK